MKVHLAISSYRGFPRECLGAIRVAENCLRESGVEVYSPDYFGSADIADGRNQILAKRPEDADYTVFIDDDMMPEPMALVKLLQLDAPVMSAACTTRAHPIEICIKYWSEETQEFIAMDDIPRNRVFTERIAVGTAFCAIRKDVIGQLVEHYLSAADWMEENRRLFDRLHVRAENREKERAQRERIRRYHWEKSRAIRIFRFHAIDNDIELGEDVTLGYRLMQLGIKVTVDPRIFVGHYGGYPYSLQEYLSSDDRLQIARMQAEAKAEAVRRNGGVLVSV